MKRRAAALTNCLTFDQLCDAVISKLVEHFEGQLPSKQRVVGSNPSRDTIANPDFNPNSHSKRRYTCNSAYRFT